LIPAALPPHKTPGAVANANDRLEMISTGSRAVMAYDPRTGTELWKVRYAGWSMVASIFHLEPWFIGGIFFLFLLGAASTKDFSDMPGDRLGGCRTLPIVYGVGKAARMVAPFFVLPWFLMPLGAYLPDPLAPGQTILTGNPVLLSGFGLGLGLWGCYVVYLILRDPEALAESENHPSWTHMYLMMMVAQLGFAASYLL